MEVKKLTIIIGVIVVIIVSSWFTHVYMEFKCGGQLDRAFQVIIDDVWADLTIRMHKDFYEAGERCSLISITYEREPNRFYPMDFVNIDCLESTKLKK